MCDLGGEVEGGVVAVSEDGGYIQGQMWFCCQKGIDERTT